MQFLVDIVANHNYLLVFTRSLYFRLVSDDQKSINSYNFDVNELKQPKMPLKTLQKGSTGGSKRVRPLRESGAPSNERDNQFASSPINNGYVSGMIVQNSQDLNLASSSNQRSNSKSSATPKLFDDLKENVYLEVSALIAANESRPHFLINLFRELQLISSSDPLRKRLMQVFQEVYMQHCESNAISNILPDMQATVSNNQVRRMTMPLSLDSKIPCSNLFSSLLVCFRLECNSKMTWRIRIIRK